MATTAAGTPYVESSDLVANYPGVSLALANHIDGLDGGKVLQVVSADYSTQTSSTSATYVTTGLTATITPSLSTSRIIILATTSGRKNGTTGQGYYSLFRGTAAGTNIGPEVNAFGSNSDVYWGLNLSGIDSPNTTSAQIYTLCMRVANSNTILAQTGTLKAQMILMEVAA